MFYEKPSYVNQGLSGCTGDSTILTLDGTYEVMERGAGYFHSIIETQRVY